MLTTLRDDQGRIQAACDWMPVDEHGRYHPTGNYIWVEQLELNPFVSSQTMIRRVIEDIAARCPWAVGAYWERRDRMDGTLHAFRRRQLVRTREVIV